MVDMLDMAGRSWSKRGIIIPPSAGLTEFTHASHPCVLHIQNDDFLLIFSMRNMQKRSHIFAMNCHIKDGKIDVDGLPRLVLGPGKMGTFDCEGLLSCCAVKIDDQTAYFYYSGWNNYAENLWLCDTGLAKVNLETFGFERCFDGPVMCRSRYNPYFAAGTSVIKEGDTFRSWYNSGLDWYKDTSGVWTAKYGVHYAESTDGIDWEFKPGLLIPFKDGQEHSFGRPTVIRHEGGYHMWFSCRGARGNPQYRIGYASSSDGYSWDRNDDLAGIEISPDPEAFDSEAQAYPYPFEHNGVVYMLYNGNNYGATGVGYAVMEERR